MPEIAKLLKKGWLAIRSSGRSRNQLLIHVLSGTAGVVYLIGASQVFGFDPPVNPLVVGSFNVMAILGSVLGRHANTVWSMTVCLFGGVCLGVLVNAAYDSIVKHAEHNLFPFEIIIDSFLTVPGFIAGLAMARQENGRT